MCGVSSGLSIRSVRMFSRSPLAMMTRMPAWDTLAAVVDFECIPPRPKALFSDAIDVGEQDERVGFHHLGDEARQFIVIGKHQLSDRDGVVLVDDG